MSTSSRVVKNTGFLYVRMGLTLFVSLYSTRLILASLGELDFGIFNVIGGSIAMLGFLNSTMANATQRFMSFAEGKGDLHGKRKIFNVSLILHIIIALATTILLLFMMPLLFDEFLNIPSDRIYTARLVYFTLIFSTILTIINVPYDAMLNAHENMFYYAVIGVITSLLKLGISFMCVYSDGDRLLLYSMLMAVVPLITLTVMKVYCHRKYPECVISLKKYWDLDIVKKIGSFSTWNFLTAISSLFTVQGLSVVLNHFFGAKLNAAQGIANQVNGQLSSFSVTMMKALNPVIVKRTATSGPMGIASVTYTGCKFSVLLMILFFIPVSIKMDFIFSIWLEEVPDWAVTFCQLQLIQTAIVQVAAPSATAVYGRGDIKNYAIWKSIMNIMPLMLTIIAFFCKGSPVWLYLSSIIFMGIGGDIVIVLYAKKKCGLPIKQYIYSVVLPIFFTTLIMVILGVSVSHTLSTDNIWALILCSIATSIGLLISLSTFGLTKTEKETVKNLLIKITKRNLHSC